MEASPLDQIVEQTIATGADPLRTKRYPKFGPWMGAQDLTGRLDTLYAIPRPIGLTADGRLRTSDDDSPGEPEQFISLHGTTSSECVNPSDPPCETQLEEAKGRGYKMVGPRYTLYDLAYQLGLHTLGVIGGRQFDDPAPRTIDWGDFEDNAQVTLNKDGVVHIAVDDEGLEHGLATELYYEMVYRAREINRRHPIIVNNEPDIVTMREMRDFVEILTDTEYLFRASGTTALCDLVNRLLEIKVRVPYGRASGIYQLVGFVDGEPGEPENEAYYTAGPDTVGIQTLAAVLLGVDSIDHYHRFDSFKGGPEVDLKLENEDLWSALPSILGVADSVRAWTAVNEPYEIAFAGTGVPECEEAPVLYGYGRWDAEQYEGRLGTWFAICNFSQDGAQTLQISWSDMRLPDPNEVEDLYVVVDSDSAGRGIELDLVLPADPEPEGLDCTLPATRWIVGRVVWELNPASVGDQMADAQAEVPYAFPNPLTSRTTLFLPSGPGHEVVECSLYGPDGRRVRRFQEVETSRDPVRILWDGRDSHQRPLPSGCYFLKARTKAGDVLTTRVMIVR
jgi:hypothetical protein